MDAVNVVVGKVVDLLFTQARDEVRYLLRYKENVTKLNQKTDDLKGVRERMQGRIDESLRKGEVIELDILAWIASVDAVISEAEAFLVNGDAIARKTACFNLGSRYRFSKKAMRKTSLVVELHEKGNKFVTVSHAPPPPGIDAYSSKNIGVYESQNSTLKEVMNTLEEEQIHVVGVCGIGGVGKTTLVTELGKRLKASKRFGEVVMAVVSQQINIKKIQDDIAGLLGMEKLPDDESRRGKLWDRIRKGNKVLVILDDVWSRLDLDQLGVPVGTNDQSTVKVVLTSRSKDVCNDMDAQKVISVQPMPEGEAWFLFKQMVGEAVETNQEINLIAKDVARECKGLPIAILAVGRALRGKNKVEWEDAYHQLRKAAPLSVNPMLREVFPKLVLSFNYLESEDAKLCFLLCSMFPEDYDIPVESLVYYGMGLKLFRHSGTSLQDARRVARNVINTLKQSYLLLNGYDSDHVKLHDVFRDVAIAITSKDDEKDRFLVNAGVGLTVWPDIELSNNYTGISLMHNHISELCVGLECAKLDILLLQGNEALEMIPNEYFHGMENLKVLDLHKCGVSLIPPSISLLTTLRTLHLDHSMVQDISSLEGLVNLEILSLSSTDIAQIPEQIGRLTNLRLLDVRDCHKLSGITPGVISNLRKLQDLYIGHSFVEWDIERETEVKKNASLMELNSLHWLTNLDVVMSDADMFSQSLRFKSLQRFIITIGGDESCPNDWYGYTDCSILSLTLDTNMRLQGWIKKLMEVTDCLGLKSVNNQSCIISDLKEVNFNKVRFLEVSSCNDVSFIADMTDLDSTPIFCKIEELQLFELHNFTQLCQVEVLPRSGLLSKLSKIIINDCHNMSTALGFDILSPLSNLKTLEVCRCDSLEYIVGSPHECCMESTDSSNIGAPCLPNLEGVTLSECKNLKCVFSPFIAQGLPQLQNLTILRCEKVETIIGAEKNMDITEAAMRMEKMTMFPSLESIHLFDLPSLKGFCSQHYNMVEYPSLWKVIINSCHSIEAWGYGIQLTPHLKEDNLIGDGSAIMALKLNGAYGTELMIPSERSCGSLPRRDAELQSMVLRAAALFTIVGTSKKARKKKKHASTTTTSSSV